MKKFVRILALVICALLLVSLAACNGPKFMSSAKVKKLVKEYGTPQAQLTLNFTSNGKKMKYVITYDLLLDKTPVTVVSFINLVNDGFYDNVVFQSYDSSYNYYRAAGYNYRADSEGKSKVMQNVSDKAIIGEFKSNLYSEPTGGYSEFSMFALAMYHGGTANDFNSANGELIFSTSATKTLQPTNYAVFAKLTSISIYEGDSDTPRTYTKVPTECWEMTKLTTTTNCSVTTPEGESKTVSILGSSYVPRFVFSIEMLGDKDWSKLPKVN